MNDILGHLVVAAGLLIAVSPLLVVAGMYINACIYDLSKWVRNR